MSCRLYVNTNFAEWAAASEYAPGTIIQHLFGTYICRGGLNIDEEPNISEHWIPTRDIDYNILHETWASSDSKTYAYGDVVEHDLGGGLKLYLCVLSHDNDSALTDLGISFFWQEIEIACLLKETYKESQGEFVDTLNLQRGDVISYNDINYAFIDNSGVQISEEPGTFSSINAGQQFEDITGLFNDEVDFEFDNAPTVYSNTTLYAKNAKVEYQEAYYVSKINNNVANSPLDSDTWEIAHPKEAELITAPTEVVEWAAGTYTWGDEVKNGDFIYTSSVYQNTTIPGTDDGIWRLIVPVPKSNCLDVVPVPYYPNVYYSKQDVVNSQGNKFQSLLDQNNYALTNEDAWVACDEAVQEDCSVNSLGQWSAEPFYTKGQVVQYLGNWYIATTANGDKKPNQYPEFWKICKSAALPCDHDGYHTPWDSGVVYTTGSPVSYDGILWISTDENNLNNIPSYKNIYWAFCKIIEYVPGLVTKNLYETLIYSEAIKYFDAFVDYSSAMYMEVNGKSYSFDDNQKLWVHEGGDYGSYHGAAPSMFKIVVVVNETVGLRTVYDSIMAYAETNDIKFNRVAVRTNFVETQEIFDKDHRYRFREGIHTMPARGIRDDDRVRGNWMEVTYEITGKSGQNYEFTYVSSDYLTRQSMRP